MPRFIGNKFGDFVGVNTVSGFCDSGVYNYNDQVFLKEAGAWEGFSATGGLESTPGNGYKYHTFLSSGSFVVSGTTHPTGMEVLVVAGGGGGGAGVVGQGGGGGGGLRVQGGPSVAGPTGSHGPATPLTIPVGSTTITVGEGGTAGVNGGNSSIGSLLVGTGGGSGGNSPSPYAGSPGGSSGGASNTEGGAPTNGNAGGFSPFPEGNNGGGSAGAVGNEAGGGGGGAGGNGGTAPGDASAGDGGAGLQLPAFNAPLLHPNASPLAPLSGFFAGGGGGGTIRTSDGRGEGGSGGGGNGANTNPTITGLSQTGSDGAANSGGGGGGGAIERPALPNNGASYSGGDGIVVIRYTV